MNDFFNAKFHDAGKAAREEAEAVAREVAKRESKRQKRAMSPELRTLLAQWGLESEEGWLLEFEVFTLEDLQCLEDDDMAGRDCLLRCFVVAMKARKSV